MIKMSIIENDEDDGDDVFDTSYSEVGIIAFRVLSTDTSYHGYERYEIETLHYDGSAFWIDEGMGIDFFINEMDDPSELQEGEFYIITNITGEYVRGDYGFTEDEEHWYHDDIRKMTSEEFEQYGHLTEFDI